MGVLNACISLLGNQLKENHKERSAGFCGAHKGHHLAWKEVFRLSREVRSVRAEDVLQTDKPSAMGWVHTEHLL